MREKLQRPEQLRIQRLCSGREADPLRAARDADPDVLPLRAGVRPGGLHAARRGAVHGTFITTSFTMTLYAKQQVS